MTGREVTTFHQARLDAVHAQLRRANARSVLDLGCGDGPLFTRLAADPLFHRLVALDLSDDALRRLEERLAAAEGTERRIELIRGSFTATHPELAGFDAAILVETIEHVDPGQLHLVEKSVFQEWRPATIIITTPNVEFNDLLGVPRQRLRHPGHRFEWSRAKFRTWSAGVGRRAGYSATFHDVGASHPQLGGPTQMVVFTRS